jgi:DNA modification methylase
LRDYGAAGQLGLERTPEEYTANMVEIFREVRRILRDDGTVWLNIGDCYATGAGKAEIPGGGYRGSHDDAKRPKWAGPYCQPNRMPIPGLKPKDLIGIPWRLAFALQADGWYLRSEIIWNKPNPMPESVTDRPTKSHEQIFLLAKSERYYYDAEAIKEPATDTGRINGRDGRNEDASARPPGTNPRTLKRLDYTEIGRNKRSVWTVTTNAYPGAHFATFSEELIEPCIKAGCPAGGLVLDPFAGSGTTAAVARRFACRALLIDINEEYCKMAAERLAQEVFEFAS